MATEEITDFDWIWTNVAMAVVTTSEVGIDGMCYGLLPRVNPDICYVCRKHSLEMLNSQTTSLFSFLLLSIKGIQQWISVASDQPISCFYASAEGAATVGRCRGRLHHRHPHCWILGNNPRPTSRHHRNLADPCISASNGCHPTVHDKQSPNSIFIFSIFLGWYSWKVTNFSQWLTMEF